MQTAPANQFILVTDPECPEYGCLYDQRVRYRLPEGFVESIHDEGIMQAVEVIPADDGRMVVVDGRQRVKGALEIGPHYQVPYVLAPSRDMVELLARSNKANINRLEDEPAVMRAKAVRQLTLALESMTHKGQAWEMVAKTFGRSVDTIRLWAKVEELTPETRGRLDNGEITLKQAVSLHGQDAEGQAEGVKGLLGKNAKKPGSGAHNRKRWGKRHVSEVVRRARDRAFENRDPDDRERAMWALIDYLMEDGTKEPERIQSEEFSPILKFVAPAFKEVYGEFSKGLADE